MDQKRKWIAIILGVSILGIICIVLIGNALSNDGMEPVSPTQQPTASSAPTSTTAPTSTVTPAPTAEPEANDAAGMSATAEADGYGGPILVKLALDDQGQIASIEIGDERFAETEELGALVREEDFTEQFIGKTPPLALNEDVDAISGATVSSQAVVDAVNEAAAYLTQKQESSDTN